MDDLDAILAENPAKPESAVTLTQSERKCRRHEWAWAHVDDEQPWQTCIRCGRDKDEARSRLGKSVVARSKREERKLARDYGGIRTGHHGGPDDVQTALLNVQSKAGSSWWSSRYALELDKLPRTGGRSPALIVSNGQPGSLVRRVVVMDEKDFRALYGDRILDGDG